MNIPLPGNCLIGALLIKLFKGGRVRRIRVRGQGVRHWICQTNSGNYHFKRVKDVLPHPLCYLIFIGRFERMKRREQDRDGLL